MATRKPGLGPQLRTIEDAHDRLGLSYAELAGSLGADESTLRRWLAGVPFPGPVVACLDRVRTFIGEVDRTFGDVSAARQWIERPSAALSQRAPRELIAAGEIDRITGMLYALNAGIPT